MHDAVRQARALNAVSQPLNAHREAPIDRLSAGSNRATQLFSAKDARRQCVQRVRGGSPQRFMRRSSTTLRSTAVPEFISSTTVPRTCAGRDTTVTTALRRSAIEAENSMIDVSGVRSRVWIQIVDDCSCRWPSENTLRHEWHRSSTALLWSALHRRRMSARQQCP